MNHSASTRRRRIQNRRLVTLSRLGRPRSIFGSCACSIAALRNCFCRPHAVALVQHENRRCAPRHAQVSSSLIFQTLRSRANFDAWSTQFFVRRADSSHPSVPTNRSRRQPRFRRAAHAARQSDSAARYGDAAVRKPRRRIQSTAYAASVTPLFCGSRWARRRCSTSTRRRCLWRAPSLRRVADRAARTAVRDRAVRAV